MQIPCSTTFLSAAIPACNCRVDSSACLGEDECVPYDLLVFPGQGPVRAAQQLPRLAVQPGACQSFPARGVGRGCYGGGRAPADGACC
eukprot:11171881-Lingulodinium_polyedra.AAC.1